jgi:D-glycero-alpha-D-manno-heptose 1-phosphate guanylyltransferase
MHRCLEERGRDVMSRMANITAVILAGGLGTRLRSIVPDKPKVLAELGGRPFIEYLLDQLALEGVKSVVLCTGYLGDQVQTQLGTTHKNMTLRYSCELQPLGTGGALRLALPIIESDTILVLNGDSYCDVRLNEFAEWHAYRDSSATILLSRTNDTRRYGRVDVDDEGHILRFSEKTESQDPGWINAGIYLLQRDVIDSIPCGLNVSIERKVFPHWVNRGLYGFRTESRLWDIGVPDAYAEATADFIDSLSQ